MARRHSRARGRFLAIPRIALAVACLLPVSSACVAADSAATSLEDLVAGFTRSLPGRGSEGMRLPTRRQGERLVAGVRAVQAGDLERARRLVGPLGYEVRAIVDTATGRRADVLTERRGPRGHGWGMVVLAEHPSTQLVVEVTHPLFDVGTSRVGVAAFRRADAAALLVAGAHRYANADGSSDVAHDRRTMFARLDRALVSSQQTVLQPHGFDREAQPTGDDVARADVVVSAGVSPAPPTIERMATRLRAASFRVCVYDGDDCAALGATTNVEGAWAHVMGADFIHLELSREVRDDPSRSDDVVEAVADTLLEMRR